MVMDPLDFLDSVAGHTAARYPVQTPLLGTVDPAYTTGNPKITFDGETTLSGKTYLYAGYTPQAGDRVVLLPVGNSYLVIAAIGVLDGRGKAPLVHSHAESDVTSLVADLAGKAAAVHTHAESDVTSLTTDLAARSQGVVGRNRRTTSISTTATTSGTAQRIISAFASVVSGRTYKLWAHLEIDAATVPATSQVEMRTTTDGTEPTVFSTQVARALTDHRVASVPDSLDVIGLYPCGFTGTLGVMVAVFCAIGSGTLTNDAATTSLGEIVIEDMGPTVSTSGTVY